MKRALIVVDVQNDFCPGGSLPVPNGADIVPVINAIRDKFDIVVFTMDSHPKDHCSFKDNGGIWPNHCIIRSEGHLLRADLNARIDDFYVLKGQNPKFDSYSGFKDDGGEETILNALLKAQNIDQIYVCGLALEYCVAFTAIDGAKLGHKTIVITDASRHIGDEELHKQREEMGKNGIRFCSSKDI